MNQMIPTWNAQSIYTTFYFLLHFYSFIINTIVIRLKSIFVPLNILFWEISSVLFFSNFLLMFTSITSKMANYYFFYHYKYFELLRINSSFSVLCLHTCINFTHVSRINFIEDNDVHIWKPIKRNEKQQN